MIHPISNACIYFVYGFRKLYNPLKKFKYLEFHLLFYVLCYKLYINEKLTFCHKQGIDIRERHVRV